jgi:hypothetical protein
MQYAACFEASIQGKPLKQGVKSGQRVGSQMRRHEMVVKAVVTTTACVGAGGRGQRVHFPRLDRET